MAITHSHRLSLVAVMLFASAIWTACRPTPQEEHQDPDMPSIQVVKQSHTPTLLALDGVVGVAIGETDGTPCIRVFLEREDAALREKIPTTLEGHPVEAVVTGSFRAGG